MLANGRLLIATELGTIQSFGSSANHAPGTPTLLGTNGRPVDAAGASVSWGASVDPDGDAVSYQVRLDNDGEILETWATRVVTAAGQTTLRVPGDLHPGATYVVAVRARDTRGAWSAWSAPRTFLAATSPTVTIAGVSQSDLGAALTAARPGTVIMLGAGTFHLADTLKVPAGVSLVGAGAHQTIFDATGRWVGVALHGSSPGHPTRLGRLTVAGAAIGVDVVDARDAQLTNVILRDNTEAGVRVSTTSTANITNATVVANNRGVDARGTVAIRNSVLTQNDIGLATGRPEAVTSRFNDLFDNQADYVGMLAGAADLASRVAFVDTVGKDFHLLPHQLSTDMGDPDDDFSAEPAPNGGRINLGAFGGTAEAELSAAPPDSPAPAMGTGCSVAGDDARTASPSSPLGFGLMLIGLALTRARRRTRRPAPPRGSHQGHPKDDDRRHPGSRGRRVRRWLVG
ncbi:MAG: fibronectin type III domain-containing protein, partial [Pseudomonadota bacterium]